jgi:hypothetical protein
VGYGRFLSLGGANKHLRIYREVLTFAQNEAAGDKGKKKGGDISSIGLGNNSPILLLLYIFFKRKSQK